MKFCRGLLISTGIGSVSAFSSNLSPVSHNQLLQKDVRKHITALSADKSPHPPDYLPRVDEQLELDLMDSERRVMLYEKEVEMIREQLDLKQSELLDEQNLFREEKSNLMKKISEFTTILAQRDKELESAMKPDETSEADSEANLARQAELENIIQSLEAQLEEKAKDLENEKKSSDELRKRFGDAEDALEYEQMNFEKERRLLQELVTNERKQVKELQDKFEENGKSFESTREELLSKIQNEEQKLRDTKANWKATQEQLKVVEDKLEISLQEKAKLLEESEKKSGEEKAAMSKEIEFLQNTIKDQQTRMEEIQSGLKKENEEFENSRNALASKIAAEEKMIKDLQDELAEEQKNYEAEKSILDREITSITSNLATVETQLENERVNFSKEKEMLEKKLAEEVRVGRLKKKQMKARYDEIRREMTDLWESSKRQARQEENRLRKKYRRKLETVQAQVAKLESDLTAEKERRLVETKGMQSKYSEELKSRDAVILELEGSVTSLGKLIADKDRIIQEKTERIERYETSFRQVAKLGFVVTGKKLKKVAGPLKRLIQNSPPSDDL